MKLIIFTFIFLLAEVTGCFANASVRQRPVRQRIKLILQRSRSVGKRLYVSSPTFKILFEKDLKWTYKSGGDWGEFKGSITNMAVCNTIGKEVISTIEIIKRIPGYLIDNYF